MFRCTPSRWRTRTTRPPIRIDVAVAPARREDLVQVDQLARRRRARAPPGAAPRSPPGRSRGRSRRAAPAAAASRRGRARRGRRRASSRAPGGRTRRPRPVPQQSAPAIRKPSLAPRNITVTSGRTPAACSRACARQSSSDGFEMPVDTRASLRSEARPPARSRMNESTIWIIESPVARMRRRPLDGRATQRAAQPLVRRARGERDRPPGRPRPEARRSSRGARDARAPSGSARAPPGGRRRARTRLPRRQRSKRCTAPSRGALTARGPVMRSRWRQPGVRSSAVALSRLLDDGEAPQRGVAAPDREPPQHHVGAARRDRPLARPVSSSRTVSATPARASTRSAIRPARGRARAQRQRLGGRRDQEDEAERQRERGGAPHRTRTGGPATEPERTLKVPGALDLDPVAAGRGRVDAPQLAPVAAGAALQHDHAALRRGRVAAGERVGDEADSPAGRPRRARMPAPLSRPARR